MRTSFKQMILFLFVLLGCTSFVYAAEEPVLNVYNWSDYIAPETLETFEKETGIKVKYDVYDSNEVLEAKLFSGKTGYDIVTPTSTPFLARQIIAGIYQPLDKAKLPNYEHLDKEILAKLAEADPNNAHAIPWSWSSTGIGYNVEKIKAIDPNAPTDSWQILFDPKYAEKFASCGIGILDSPTDVFSSIFTYLGKPINTHTKEGLKEAEAIMAKVRPFIRYFHSSQYINDLANGDVCLVLGWSGDVLQARDRAAEAGKNIDIAYVIPKEGAMLTIDAMAIPKDAPHPENAHKFLNFIMRPKSAAEFTEATAYASANKDAHQFIDKELLGDKGIFPSEETKQKLALDSLTDAQYDKLSTRTWTRIKTGK